MDCNECKHFVLDREEMHRKILFDEGYALPCRKCELETCIFKIKIMDKQQLRQNYENACNAYLKAFCEKHDFSIEDAFWVGDDVGGILNIGDMDFDLKTIRTDIDEDAPDEELIKWYDYTLDAAEFNLTKPNFHAWIHGCPRTSKEWFEEMRERCKWFENAIKEENERVNKENEDNKF